LGRIKSKNVIVDIKAWLFPDIFKNKVKGFLSNFSGFGADGYFGGKMDNDQSKKER